MFFNEYFVSVQFKTEIRVLIYLVDHNTYVTIDLVIIDKQLRHC